MIERKKLAEILGKKGFEYYQREFVRDYGKLGLEARNLFYLAGRAFPLKRKRCYPLNSKIDSRMFEQFNFMLETFLINFRKIKKVENRKIYREKVLDLLYGTGDEYNQTHGDVIAKTGTIIQSKTFNFSKGGGSYALREMVTNYVKKIDDFSEADSLLILENLETGVKLDLSHLLPSTEIFFSPWALSPISEEDEASEKKNEGDIKLNGIMDIDRYAGTGKAEQSGYSYGHSRSFRFMTITYGNLVARGGMLKLLHEIAHAWYASGTTDQLLKRFFRSINVLCKKGKSLNNFISKLNPYLIVHDIVFEEMLAWLNARQVLLYLRGRGIDLEPGMSDFEIEALTNRCLQTHFDSLRDRLALYGIDVSICDSGLFLPLNMS